MEAQTHLTIPMKIVCAEAAGLLHTLQHADTNYVILSWAYRHQQITGRPHVELASALAAAFGNMMVYLFGRAKTNKAAGEIAKEMSIF